MITGKAKICVAQKVDGQLLLRYVNVIRTITADDVKPDYEFSDYFLNIFPSGTLNGKCYAYYWRKWPYYMRGWKRLHNGAECFGATYVYSENLHEVFGESYGNVDLQVGLEGLCRPIYFLRLLQNLRVAPQAEYLFKAGLPLLAADSELPCKNTNNFAELLGLSKQYLTILRETQATAMEIEVIAAAGRWVPEGTVRQLCSLNLDWDSLYTLRGLIRYNSLGRILRYLAKQRTLTHSQLRRRKMPYVITMYRDYLHMAQDLKSDMKKKAILEPRDLKAQHDLLLARINEQKEEEQKRELSRPIDQGVYWWTHDYANRDFTVVYLHNRLDFITEGQSLNHCVGSMRYYERHIQGRQMVFFIRKTGQPDKPYFTTEIDVESGHIQQLYGFADCSAPKEVRTFVEGFVKAIGRWRHADAMAS